jgi:hypothetical protein
VPRWRVAASHEHDSRADDHDREDDADDDPPRLQLLAALVETALRAPSEAGLHPHERNVRIWR